MQAAGRSLQAARLRKEQQVAVVTRAAAIAAPTQVVPMPGAAYLQTFAAATLQQQQYIQYQFQMYQAMQARAMSAGAQGTRVVGAETAAPNEK